MDWKDACMEKTLALPNENEICEVGAMIRDAGLRISNSDVSIILSKFVYMRNQPEICTAAKKAVQCFQACTLTPADADFIVKELGYVAHGWTVLKP